MARDKPSPYGIAERSDNLCSLSSPDLKHVPRAPCAWQGTAPFGIWRSRTTDSICSRPLRLARDRLAPFGIGRSRTTDTCLAPGEGQVSLALRHRRTLRNNRRNRREHFLHLRNLKARIRNPQRRVAKCDDADAVFGEEFLTHRLGVP